MRRRMTLHCECGHSKTWTHECPSVIVPIAGQAVDMPTDPPKGPGAASPKEGGIR